MLWPIYYPLGVYRVPIQFSSSLKMPRYVCLLLFRRLAWRNHHHKKACQRTYIAHVPASRHSDSWWTWKNSSATYTKDHLYRGNSQLSSRQSISTRCLHLGMDHTFQQIDSLWPLELTQEESQDESNPIKSFLPQIQNMSFIFGPTTHLSRRGHPSKCSLSFGEHHS